MAIAALALAAPLLNAATTGDHLLRTVHEGNWAIAGMDLALLATAVTAALVARQLFRRRARTHAAGLALEASRG